MKEQTIGACMIVRDAEKRLGACLASLEDVVDDIVVVDTGSADSSVQIAEKAGARVYHHPWENSFSMARNQALSYMESDWIFIIDADEILDSETGGKVKAAITIPRPINALTVDMINHLPGDGQSRHCQVRLVRNGCGFHYEGTVHNRPTVQGAIGNTSVQIFHHGYNEDMETTAKKFLRRVTMISELIKNEPENPGAYAQLAQALLMLPRNNGSAILHAKKSIELMDKYNMPANRYPRAYYPLIFALWREGKFEEAVDACLDCLDVMPDWPDPTYFLVVYYNSIKPDKEKLILWGERFLELHMDKSKKKANYIYMETHTATKVEAVGEMVCEARKELGYA